MYRFLVNRGVKLLNRQRPGWFNKVNLDELVMWSPYNCLIAQLHDDLYQAGLDALGLKDGWKYGFDIGYIPQPHHMQKRKYDKLTRLWKDKIAELRTK